MVQRQNFRGLKHRKVRCNPTNMEGRICILYTLFWVFSIENEAYLLVYLVKLIVFPKLPFIIIRKKKRFSSHNSENYYVILNPFTFHFFWYEPFWDLIQKPCNTGFLSDSENSRTGIFPSALKKKKNLLFRNQKSSQKLRTIEWFSFFWSLALVPLLSTELVKISGNLTTGKLDATPPIWRAESAPPPWLEWG